MWWNIVINQPEGKFSWIPESFVLFFFLPHRRFFLAQKHVTKAKIYKKTSTKDGCSPTPWTLND